MPKTALQTKLGFNLNLTPLLKNSFRLLSMPYMELLSEINQALENNILLTEDQSKNTENSYSAHTHADDNSIMQIESKQSLFVSLENQLRNANLTTQQYDIASIIIENLTEEGFLEVDIDVITRVYLRNHPKHAINAKDCELVRSYIQDNFEPFGIASLNTQDFLLLQVNHQPNIDHKTLIIQLLSGKIDLDLISSKQRQQFLATIKSLAKTPVDNFDANIEQQYIHTDITVDKDDGDWRVSLRALPAIVINKEYLSLRSQIQDKTLFNEHLVAARGLVSFIEYRNQCLQLIARMLVIKQEQALTKGVKFLTPLSQKQLASELNMGESTLSRLIKDRYMNTPIGVIKIKDLFSSNVGNHASKSVKQIISEIIHQEAKALSDQKITNLLIEKNITISRRTVTKYREALKIPCARNRIHSSI